MSLSDYAAQIDSAQFSHHFTTETTISDVTTRDNTVTVANIDSSSIVDDINKVDLQRNLIGSNDVDKIVKKHYTSCIGQSIISHNYQLKLPQLPFLYKGHRRVSNIRIRKSNCFKPKPHSGRKVSDKPPSWNDATSSISTSSAPVLTYIATDVDKCSPDSFSRSHDNIVDSISRKKIPRFCFTSSIYQNCQMTLEVPNTRDVFSPDECNRKSTVTGPDKLITSRSLSPDHHRNSDTKSETKFSAKTDMSALAPCKGKINLSIICQFSRITILLKEAQSLRSCINPVCNPFVRIQLVSSIPNSLNIPLFDTEVFSNSNNPVFDKSFTFNISQLDYHKRIVVYTYHVQDIDIELLGCMSFGIRKFLNKTQISGWYYLLKQEIGSKKHLRASGSSVSSLFSISNSALSDSKSTNSKTQTGCQIFEVKLLKGPNGFGFTLCGGSPVYISHVDVDSSAEIAGIHPGDMIIKIDNFNISQSSTEAVVRMFRMCSKSVKVTVLRSPSHQIFRPLPPVPVTIHGSKTFPCIHTLSGPSLLSISHSESQQSHNLLLSKAHDQDLINTDAQPDSNNHKGRFDSKSVHFKSKVNETDSNNPQKALRTSQSANGGIFEQTQGESAIHNVAVEIPSGVSQQIRIPGESCNNAAKNTINMNGRTVVGRLQYQGHLKKVDFSQHSPHLELFGVVSLKEGNCLFPVHLYLFRQVLLIGQLEPDGYITVIKEPIYCSKICYANIPAYCNDELILQYINEVGRKQFVHIQASNIKEWLCRIQRLMVYNCNWWMANVA